MDCRDNLLLKIKGCMASKFSPDDTRYIIDVLTREIGNYNVTEKSTELATQDQSTETVLQMFAGSLLTSGKSKNTVKLYITILRRFNHYANKPLIEVNTFDIRMWLAKLQQTVSLRTCENYRAYLSSFYQWCVNEDIIAKNPMAKITPIKYEDSVRLPFNDVEIDSLRSSCKTLRERAELEVFLSSGARASELCAMNRSDIDLNTLTVVITEGKGNKQRTTYINDVCKRHLSEYLASRTDNDECLFYSREHKRITKNSIENDLKRIGKRANVSNVHPHRCRRTFATSLSKKGMTAPSIQKLMGHSNINTTMEYISLDDQFIKNEYRRCL